MPCGLVLTSTVVWAHSEVHWLVLLMSTGRETYTSRVQKKNSCVYLEEKQENASDWEMFDLWQEKNACETDCEMAFTKQKHKTVEFISNWDLLCEVLHLRGEGKVQKLVWSPSNLSLAKSVSIYTSFWKLILSALSTVKTDFQTQSPQQSIFPWQA